MAASHSPATAVLEALGFALFLRDENGTLRLHGAPPAWLSALWIGLTSAGEELPLAEASPFLENFLIDAEDCWAKGAASRAQSGAWIEQTATGAEVSLEATALTVDGRAALLLERLGEVFEAKKSMLQKARETVIAYQRLNAETQKKEILLSCIAEEMNSALANAVTALRLIEMEKHSPRAQQLLSLAMRATEEQQALINKVLNVFAAEIEGLYGREGDGTAEASLGEALPQAVETVAAAAAEKNVGLVPPDESTHSLKVAMNSDHLVRVLAGLLENALQNSKPGSEITLAASEEADTVLLAVTDRGPTLPTSTAENFFSKDVLASDDASAAQLRLQFCRIAVEKCQGEFGSEPGEEGGNRFWVRLPKAASAPAR